MALVVSGQIKHPPMQPSDVHASLRTQLPGLTISGLDFAIDLNNCKVEFFCNTTSTLDFTVTVPASGLPVPAAVALLVRETDALTSALISSLGGRFRRAEVKYCLLEDHRSRSELLSWSEEESPMTSRPAKLSYVISVLLIVLAIFLVKGQLDQPQSDARDYNVLSLILAIGLPALTLPLPFIFEQLRPRIRGRWTFSHRP